MKYFKNVATGYIEKYSTGWSPLWCFLFGWLYWVVRGNWRHGLISFVVGSATLGFSSFIYPFFANGINIKTYKRTGWIELGENDRDLVSYQIENENGSSKILGFIFIILIGVLAYQLFQKYSSGTMAPVAYYAKPAENKPHQETMAVSGNSSSLPDNLTGIVNQSDWQVISGVLPSLFQKGEGKNQIKWSNPETGARGILYQSGTGIDDHGCRQFKIYNSKRKKAKGGYVDFCEDGTVH